MCLSWLQHRLLAHDSFTLYLTGHETCIINMPAPPLQLYREVPAVFYGYPIGKDIVILTGAGVGGLVLRFYRYFYAVRDFCYHSSQKYQFFLF